MISPHIVRIIDDWLVEHGQTSAGPQFSTISVEEARALLKPVVRAGGQNNLLFSFRVGATNEKIRSDIAQLKDKIIVAMNKEQEPEFESEIELPKVFSAANEMFREFFKQGVRYLGPLRDSPRPAYQPEALEITTDVGYRGEHTAAVLELNSTKSITYFDPPRDHPIMDISLFRETATAPLREAVVKWLIYLGVANDVVTTDAGVFGNRLQVSTESLGKLHDLTNVGVGVSQVLPIVATSLLAPKGCLLIFEQPELHLHPKVQARLADFFLALASDGKQTILETHSEYLVDRLRLRIAQSGDDSVRPLVNILFSEKNWSEFTKAN